MEEKTTQYDQKDEVYAVKRRFWMEANDMIIGVDFDGTLVEHQFPEIGRPNKELIGWIRRIQSKNHIILMTCRGGEYLDEAVEWCKAQGLKFCAVNEDAPHIKDSAFGRSKSNKVFADIYIDDRNIATETLMKMLKGA